MEIFNGSCVALVTPFKDGKVDYRALEKLITYQINNGTDAIVVLGTTGEPATLSENEKTEILRFAASKIKAHAKFIVGAGSNCTESTVKNCIFASEIGADGVLVITPYYNKCSQNGLYEHYKAIKNAVNIPVIAYNVPSRTGVNMLPATVARLANENLIDGLKDSTGNVVQFAETARLTHNKLPLYSGEDALTLPLMSLGARGVISVLANVEPSIIHRLTDYCLKGDFTGARKIQLGLLPLIDAMFCDVNPIPVKTALSLMGLCSSELRLPLTPPDDSDTAKIKLAMSSFGLLGE